MDLHLRFQGKRSDIRLFGFKHFVARLRRSVSTQGKRRRWHELLYQRRRFMKEWLLIAVTGSSRDRLAKEALPSTRKPGQFSNSCRNDGNPARAHYICSNVELCQGGESAG
jgi:hypothetical protein